MHNRAEELSSILSELTKRATAALELLESEPFDPPNHAGRFQSAMNLVVGVKDVAAAPVVDSSGNLTEQSGTLTVKYRAMTKDEDG